MASYYVSASEELSLNWTSQSETIEADPTQFCPQRRNRNYSSLRECDCHCVITVREVGYISPLRPYNYTEIDQ